MPTYTGHFSITCTDELDVKEVNMEDVDEAQEEATLKQGAFVLHVEWDFFVGDGVGGGILLDF